MKDFSLRIVQPDEIMAIMESERSEADVSRDVARIIDDVRKNGDAALIRLAKKFDGVELDSIAVPKRRVTVDKVMKADMKLAFDRILKFHRATADSTKIIRKKGEVVGRIVRPLARVGIYVPGGSAPLFSTLLMAAGAARAAGVERICVATPPPVADVILAAAEIAKVDELYSVGGAQAVAALAYGTRTIAPVDKIVGPGNRYVAEAKRQVFGKVGIDSIAGPSEILILADDTASPFMLAADMIAQAEHDVFARSILVTNSRRLAAKTIESLIAQLGDLPRKKIAEASLAKRGLICIARGRSEMVELANRIASEHLEIIMDKPWKIVESVQSAGAIFVGEYSPEILGDYVAGPNHILPTSGTARFSPPLSAHDFVSVSTVQSMSREAALKLAGPAARMARAEGLEGHARSIEARLAK